MEFIGRIDEQRRVNKMLSREGQQVALIYGRRRVGKSALIKHCLQNTNIPSFFYECKQVSEQSNAMSLASLISEAYDYPPIAYTSMEEVLRFFFQQALDKPLILVLDEYPYLRNTITGIDSILQSLIDTYAASSQLKVILCGSYIEVMRTLLDQDSPLYGRIDLTLNLKPMDYYDSSFFYPSFSDDDKVRLYGVFGGIPYYNRLIDSRLSVRENLIDLVVESEARLENEVTLQLRPELSKLENANEVFEAIAHGATKYSDILSQSHVSSSPALAKTLEKLENMELISRQSPINDERNRKKTQYKMSDQLSHFYYTYLFRYASQRSVMDPEVFFDRYIAEDFSARYVPQAFEEICRQFLIRQNKQGLMEEPFDKIGTYYYDDPQTKTNGEFDIVTQDPHGYIFYEAKFKSRPVTTAMVDEEIRQVEQTGLTYYRYGFISRSGFSVQPRENLRLISLEELYR